MNDRTSNLEPRTSAAGFTLIELLVTLGVMTLLTSLLIVYTRGSEVQIKILKEKAVFIGALQRAKSLAQNTVQSAELDCGYGIHVVDDQSMVIWRDLGERKCTDANQAYDGESENVGEAIHFAAGVMFRNRHTPDFLESILFIPPDPTVVTVPPSAPGGQFQIVLGTSDGGSENTMSINRFGQVESATGY